MHFVLNALPGILVALATIIPMTRKLVNAIQSLVREKRWAALMQIIVDLMAVAEEKLADGADKKEYVMSMAKTACEDVGCEWDEKVVSELIDSLCDMAKVVNAPKPDETPAPETEGVNPV